MIEGEGKINPNLKNPAIQRLDDLRFEKIGEDSPEFQSAIEVFVVRDGKDTVQDIENKARETVKTENWWLQEYWQEKGLPNEQIGVHTGNISIDVFNYGQRLADDQLRELQEVLSVIGQIPLPEKLAGIKYLVIDNENRTNVQNNEDLRGMAFRNQKMLALYPRALSSEPHRIPNTSGLKGTLLHEYGHVLQQGEFWNEWRKAFGWVSKPEEEIDWKVATPRMHDTNQPERCVSDYARISPDEDICESFAAAVNNPAVLDPERLEFIRERWLKSIQETGSMPVSIEVRAGDDIQLPKAPYVVKYKTTVSRVFIPGKVVDKE